ncbi:MAG: hypothetical protein L0287_30745 [Anaerolineae bacterium]|nr:hypothetical protein [Anaerolineae bacterium]MCI0609308.1 hypothetical protein [Anaerolineae bacterium]
MNALHELPSFDVLLPELNKFILELVEDYRAGKINSWEELEEKVNAFFTLEQMEQMESVAPGWQKMASYSGGITLVHVMCVFLGVYMMPEYQALTPEGLQMAKWIVLFHDVDKFHMSGKKDTLHAFRSGVLTANTLPVLGFTTTENYHELIRSWSKHTLHAFVASDGNAAPKPDNQKLPEILAGINQLFGEDAPATLITKAILLHISLSVDPFYSTPAPLTKEEIKRFITPSLLPLLKVMMMGDNEGWSLFEPEVRKRQYKDALAAFEEVERIIAS